MPLPEVATVSELLATLLAGPVDVTPTGEAADLESCSLSLFVTPDGEPVAAIATDLAGTASLAAALTAEPLEVAAQTIDKGAVTGDLWDSFAEVANVLTGIFTGDEFPRVLLHSALPVAGDAWRQVQQVELPVIDLRVCPQGYPEGKVSIADLTGLSRESLPGLLATAAPTNAAVPVEVDRWRPYSFKDASGLSRDTLHALQIRVAELASTMGASCSEGIHGAVRKTLLQFQQRQWSQYCANLSSPSLLVTFGLGSLEGRFVFTWPAELAAAFLDVMLGGSGSRAREAPRLSSVSLTLIEPLYLNALREVEAFFRSFAPVSLTDVRVDAEPSAVRGMLPKDEFLVMWLSTHVGGSDYQSTLGIPMGAVQPLLDGVLGPPEEPSRANPDIARRLMEIPIELRAGKRLLPMSASQLAGLRVGDVIMIDADQHSLFDLDFGTETIALARVVNSGRKLALVVEHNVTAGAGTKSHVEPAAPRHRELALSR